MRKKLFIILISLSCFLSACNQNVENKQLSLTVNSENITTAFTGTLKNGKPEGEGSFTVNTEDDDWSFKGVFTEGAITGAGTLQDYPITAIFSNTEYDGKYTGDSLNGYPNGQGEFTCESDNIKEC